MKQCSKCGTPHDREGQRYCADCHATYMREWRKTHPLNEEQRRRDNARSYAGVYLRRGKIVKQVCRECGSEESEMHHEDYDKPLDIEWLCRGCHLTIHGTAN